MAFIPTLGSVACRSLISHISGLSFSKALVFNGIDMIVSPFAERMIHDHTIPDPSLEKRVRIWVVIAGRAVGIIAGIAVTRASLGPMDLMTGIALDVTGYFAAFFLIVHAVPDRTKFWDII